MSRYWFKRPKYPFETIKLARLPSAVDIVEIELFVLHYFFRK